MLGVAGLVGALTVFLFVRGVEAPHDQCADHPGRQSEFSARLSRRPMVPFPGSHRIRRSILSTRSHRMKLTCMKIPGATTERTLSSDPGLPNHNLASEPATPPAASPKPSRIVKRVNSPVRTDERKAHSDAQSLDAIANAREPAAT